jgi:hypothetical protein
MKHIFFETNFFLAYSILSLRDFYVKPKGTNARHVENWNRTNASGIPIEIQTFQIGQTNLEKPQLV